MWAYRLVGPVRLAPAEVEAPCARSLAEGEVVLRTLCGGICGSDTPKFRGAKAADTSVHGDFEPGPAGFPMHEVVGEVVASRHSATRPGEQVVGWATASDAIAEYVRTDGDQVHGYDPALPAERAILVQPLACVIFALEQLSVRGRHAAVIGVGPIGLMFAHALKHFGAATVTGIDPVDRTKYCDVFGVDDVLVTASGEWAHAIQPADRPDLVIEAVGHQVSTLGHAVAGAAIGATILYFGIPDDEVYPLNMESLMRKNLTLVGGVTRERRRALAAADHYLRAHPELGDAMMTHTFARDAVQDAFETARTPSEARLKVVVSMDARCLRRGFRRTS